MRLAELIALIEPHAPAGKTGWPPLAVAHKLRMHFLQQWFGMLDSVMEEAQHNILLYCECAGLDAGASRLHDVSIIFRFSHLLEAHSLSALKMKSTSFHGRVSI